MKTYELLSEAAQAKVRQCNQEVGKYILKCLLSGCFAGIAVVACFTAGNYFYSHNPGLAVMIAASFFCLALFLIIYAEGELFTGNIMSASFALFDGKLKWLQMFKLLGTCYVFNLIGAIAFAFLIRLSGIWENPDSMLFINTVVAKKMAIGMMPCFIRGIICNWMVCLAIYTTTKVKSETARMLLFFLIVFAFFVSGYEHSVANFALFALSLVHQHQESISVGGAVVNLLPTTLGNIVGGGLMVGGVYFYLNKS